VSTFLSETFLAGAPILPVSSVTGQGIKELVECSTAWSRNPERRRAVFPSPGGPGIHDERVRDGGHGRRFQASSGQAPK